MLSIVIPAYNESENVTAVTLELFKTIGSLVDSFEIIFVDDGSFDNTWTIISELTSQYENIHGIRFSRNYGKESAIYAGLTKSKGDVVIVMDADLQHPPRYIPKMLSYYHDGYQIVQCIKRNRGDESIVYRFFVEIFYIMFSKMCKDIDIFASSDFVLLDREVLNAVLNYHEKNFFFRGIIASIGFKRIQIEFEVEERKIGDSKWSFSSLFSYAIHNIVSFSSKPLQLVSMIGLILLVVAFFLSIRAGYLFSINQSAPGISTVIILLCIIGSGIMLSLGIIGYYIAQIYEEVKGRPRFLIREFV